MTSAKTTLLALVAAATFSFAAHAQFSVDESTGEAHYDYDFATPAARGRYQPSLTLSYGSGNTSEIGYGLGWSLSAQWIEVTRNSSGTLQYVYVDSGTRKPLVFSSVRSGWVADVDDDAAHLTFQPSCNAFVADDIVGNHYVFTGAGTDCTGIMYLGRVTDLDGNFTEYSWTVISAPEPTFLPSGGLPPAGELSQIRYNFYDAAGTARRVALSDPYATSVDLEYAANGLLANVRIRNAGATVRRYELQYAVAPKDSIGSATVSTLTAIKEHGKESGTTLAPTTFSYYVVTVMGPVVTSAGVRYDIQYGTNGAGDWAVAKVTSSGPGMEPIQTQYSYVGWNASVTNWFDQTPETVGYSTSYAWNKTSNIVRVTSWETGSHAFRGVARQIESGPVTTAGVPPQYSVYKRKIIEHSSVTLTGTCISPSSPATQSTAGSAQDSYSATVPASSLYPVLAFVSRSRDATVVDGQELASESSVACSAIDPDGNVRQQRVDPDLAKGGNERYENATFVVASTPTTPCKNCIATQTVTADQPQAMLLASTRYGYDTTWHVNSIWKTTDPSVEARILTLQFNPNGTLASKVEVPDDEAIACTYTYDAPYQLRVAKLQKSQGTKTLTTDTVYDGFGYTVLVTGPYLGSPSTGSQVATKYDDLGRPTAIAQQPIASSTISQAIAAFSYADYNPNAPSMPAAVTSYSFATPQTYTDGFVPQTSDVKQSTSFYDALGRVIQVRERMGGTGAGDPAAHITQSLVNFRVRATFYDGAGRVRAELEPFYAASGSFTDYRSSAVDNLTANAGGLSTAVHAQLHTYDTFGREVCSAYTVVPSGGAVPPPLCSCRSNLSEAASYVRATASCYGTSGGMFAVKTIAPELTESAAPTCSATTRAPTSFFDASGTLYEADDIDGNKTQYAYDPLGNTTGIVRTSSDNLSSIASSATWDMAGRLKRRSDPDAGAQDYTYFASGRAKRLTLASHALAGGGTGSDYVDFTYDQGRLATRNVCKANSSSGAVGWTCAQDTYSYDAPQTGGTYPFVAGRIAAAQNANATIKLGYDANGAIVQLDEQVAGVAGQFSVTTARLSTGQPATTTFSSPYNAALGYTTSYDSMLRPVQLSSGATTYFNASAGSLGAYDPSGRAASISADNGGVQSSRSYAPFSSLEAGEQVHLVSANQDLYRINSEAYRGTRLASFTDAVTGTNYSYTYTDGARLKSARAATGSTLSSLLCLSFNRNKNFTPGASFGNLERVRDQASATPAVDLYSYTGTDIASSGAGPDAASSIGPQQGTPTNVFAHDYAGRITSKSSGGEVLTYDPLGRLTSVTRSNAPGEVLTYDALGQIVGRLSGSTLTYYIGGMATATTPKPTSCTTPGCPLGTSPAVTVDVHVYAGSGRIASARAGVTAPGRVLYYHRDRLGSVIATSTGGGVAGATYRYDVYGSMTVQAESVDTASELGFTGQLRLSGGLYVMGIRVYDAKLRQFLQPDVLNPMSYTYAGGDPVNRIDPTGMIDTPSFQLDHGDLGGSGGFWDGSPCSSDGSGRRTCGEEIGVNGERLPTAAGGHHTVSEIPNVTREHGGERGGGQVGGKAGQGKPRRSYWTRVYDNWVLTNKIVPGVLAPVGMTLITSQWVVPFVNGIGVLTWVGSGFQGATLGAATFTAVETGVIAAATAFTTFAFTGLAFEAGVFAGSLVEAAFDGDD
jgi:RHS repeat-associated protein